MSMYSLGQVHIDKHLSNLSIGTRPMGLIADAIAPIVTVGKQSDTYLIWGEQNFRAPNTVRNKGAISNEIDWTVSSASYFCANQALHAKLPLEDIENADEILALRESTTERLRDNMDIAREVKIASIITSTSNVGSSVTLTSSGAFSDYANSNPITAIVNGMNSVRAGAKRPANLIVLSHNVWSVVRYHPDITNAIFGDRGGVATPEQFGSIFFNGQNQGRVLIGEAIKNTGEENQANAFSDVWGDDVFIGYVSPRPAKMQPSYMYTFAWKPANFPGFRAVATRVDQGAGTSWSEYFEIHEFMDHKVTASNMGYLIKDAV